MLIYRHTRYIHVRGRNGNRYRDWEPIYKSPICNTRGDALFQLLYWVEDDMDKRLDRMRPDYRRSQGSSSRAGQNAATGTATGATLRETSANPMSSSSNRSESSLSKSGNANEQSTGPSASTGTRHDPVPPSSPATVTGDDAVNLDTPAKAGTKRGAADLVSNRAAKRVRFVSNEDDDTMQDKDQVQVPESLQTADPAQGVQKEDNSTEKERNDHGKNHEY